MKKTEAYYNEQEIKYSTKCMALLELLNCYSTALLENRREHILNCEQIALKEAENVDNFNYKNVYRVVKNQLNKVNNSNVKLESFYNKMINVFNCNSKIDDDLHNGLIDKFEVFFDENIKINKNTVEIK